jgi:signal transduction histidine kinase
LVRSLHGDTASGNRSASRGEGSTPVIKGRRRRERVGVPILARQRIAEVEHPRRPEGVKQNETAAVVHACRAIVQEFAQPVSGILAYSEMLVMDAAYTSEAQRREVEGLREGALRLERLLRGIREALSAAAVTDADPFAVNALEEAVHGLGSPRLSHREAS